MGADVYGLLAARRDEAKVEIFRVTDNAVFLSNEVQQGPGLLSQKSSLEKRITKLLVLVFERSDETGDFFKPFFPIWTLHRE